MTIPEPGTVWEQAKLHGAGRHLRVDRVDATYVHATVVRNTGEVEQHLAGPCADPAWCRRDRRGTQTTVLLSRWHCFGPVEPEVPGE